MNNCRTRADILAQCSLDLTVYHNRHARLIALLVFLVQLFVSHPASIYRYNQFQGLRLSGLPLSHQHSYPTLSSALNIFFRRRISPSFKNSIIRLEAGAFKFLRNRLFMTSMQLPRNLENARSLPRRRENNMRYSAK
jgi:hypothetical protein